MALLSGLGLLDLREKVPQVCGHGALGQPKWKHGRKESAFETSEVADRNQIHSGATVRGRGMDLPRAPRFENVRGDDRSPNRSVVRPVIAQALPDISDRPRITLGDHGEVLPGLVDLEMRDVDVGPQFSPPLREITRGLENPLRTHKSLVDYVDLGHGPDTTNSVFGGERAFISPKK